MSWKAPLVAAAAMTICAALLFHLFQRQISATASPFALEASVLPQLEEALEAQKQLAALDPANQISYRNRFNELERTVHRLQILEHNRESLGRRYQAVLLAVFALCVVVVTGAYSVRQNRNRPRLDRLQQALGRLARGEDHVQVGDRRRDVIGRMAAMIESTSRRMSRDRRRLAALRNLSRWQEAARRHAHEMRTPLTGARLELARLVDLMGDLEPTRRESLERSAAGIREELERLGRFSEQFTSFARLREPQRTCESLAALLEDFVSTYGGAWSNLALVLEVRAPACAGVDRDMLRQVLANLCDNSSAALADRRGTVTMVLDAEGGAAQIDVVDDGGGIDEAVRERLFEPYTTTRGVGEGMGLGLAISKKILLDHDGDLELLRTSAAGTVFRLTLPGER